MEIDKTKTIADLPDDAYKGIYLAMFEVVWKELYSQYSNAEKQTCLKLWKIDTIELEYKNAISKKSKTLSIKKQYKVINVSRNDNSQTLFRTQ